jgi:phosphatidylglycerophosphatase A
MSAWRQRVLTFIGTAFCLGYAPVAPGTAGALLGVGIFLLIALGAPPAAQVWLIAAALVAVCVLTIALTPWAERYWAKKDPGRFVLDEVAGFLMTVLLFRSPNLCLTVLWTFPVTRAFDILKPPPARRLERLPQGWGVLFDDLCTSLYAVGLLHVLRACFPVLFA